MFSLIILVAIFRVIPVQPVKVTCLRWPCEKENIAMQQFCVINRGVDNDVEAKTVNLTMKSVKKQGGLTMNQYELEMQVELDDLTSQVGMMDSESPGPMMASRDRDIASVYTEFAPALKNSQIIIFELAVWHGVVYCLLDGARQMADPIKDYHRCTDSLVVPNDFTKPFVCNSTATGDAAERDIADIASLLVPGGYRGLDINLPEKGQFSLEIPGADDGRTLRIFQLIDEEARFFEKETEAVFMQQALQNSTWNLLNCRSCEPPAQPRSRNKAKGLSKRHIQTEKNRRGLTTPVVSGVNVCCNLPNSHPSRFSVPRDSFTQLRSQRRVPATPLAIPNSENYGDQASPEEEIVLPPTFTRFDWNNPWKTDAIFGEMARQNAVLMPFSTKLMSIVATETVFSHVRAIFHEVTPEDTLAYDMLGIVQIDEGTWWTNRLHQTFGTDLPRLRELQAWSLQANVDIIENLRATGKFANDVLAQMQIRTQIMYSPPGVTTTTLGFRSGMWTEYGLMTLEAADAGGVILSNSKGDRIRLPVAQDAFYVTKGVDWQSPDEASKQMISVPDSERRGRVAIRKTLDIWDPSQPMREFTYWKDGHAP